MKKRRFQEYPVVHPLKFKFKSALRTRTEKTVFLRQKSNASKQRENFLTHILYDFSALPFPRAYTDGGELGRTEWRAFSEISICLEILRDDICVPRT